MHKIAMIALCALPLWADFFPQTIHTTIASVKNESVTLANPFPKNGMSGIVLHNYDKKLQAINAHLIQLRTDTIRVSTKDTVQHDKLPTINTPIHPGDEVIGGYLYHNVLLLAPDAATYEKITSMHSKNWIHPDLYAQYLSKLGDTVPSKENLKTFAEGYQVGLIYIISKNKAELLDPLSGKIIAHKAITDLPQKGKAPFFMRLDKIESGIFSSENTQSYYQIMESL